MNKAKTQSPTWLVRHGITAIFALTGVTIIPLTMIEYPDLIKVRVTLNSNNGPNPLVTKTGGRILRLLKRQNEKVAKGEEILYIESLASFESVKRMELCVAEILKHPDNNKKLSEMKTFKDLGEIEPAYQQFVILCETRLNVKNIDYYNTRRNAIKTNISRLTQKYHIIEKEIKILNLGQQSLESNFKRSSTLLENKAISNFEFEVERFNYYTNLTSIPKLEMALIDVEAEKNKNILDLNYLSEEITEQNQIFTQEANKLLWKIREWKDRYIVASQQTGILSYTSIPQIGNVVKIDQIVAHVVPIEISIYGETTIPQESIGKVTVGSPITLSIDAYPSFQFGEVSGKVKEISQIPTDNGYLSQIHLKNGLKTSRGYPLRYKIGLQATGYIPTNNYSIANRILHTILRTTSKK